MPGKADDRWFGGKPGASRKAWQGMVSHYGMRKAQQVYEATLRRNQRRGRRGRT